MQELVHAEYVLLQGSSVQSICGVRLVPTTLLSTDMPPPKAAVLGSCSTEAGLVRDCGFFVGICLGHAGARGRLGGGEWPLLSPLLALFEAPSLPPQPA